jgi:hypothetical protein
MPPFASEDFWLQTFQATGACDYITLLNFSSGLPCRCDLDILRQEDKQKLIVLFPLCCGKENPWIDSVGHLVPTFPKLSRAITSYHWLDILDTSLTNALLYIDLSKDQFSQFYLDRIF